MPLRAYAIEAICCGVERKASAGAPALMLVVAAAFRQHTTFRFAAFCFLRVDADKRDMRCAAAPPPPISSRLITPATDSPAIIRHYAIEAAYAVARAMAWPLADDVISPPHDAAMRHVSVPAAAMLLPDGYVDMLCLAILMLRAEWRRAFSMMRSAARRAICRRRRRFDASILMPLRAAARGMARQYRRSVCLSTPAAFAYAIFAA